MPSPTTALQLIRSGLGLTNAVGVDQTLTADEVSDSLAVFNDLLEIFSTETTGVFGSANQTFTTVPSQSVYTIGAGGDWNAVRPVRINDPAYSVYQGVSFECTSMTQEEYNGIPFKDQSQQFPSRYLWVNAVPLGLVTLWPVPNLALPITFSIDTILSAVSSAGATISFPPGYAMAFTYKLGVMLAPRFGKKITNYPDIVAIANDTYGSIKRANKKQRVMTIDSAYSDGNNSVYGPNAWRFQ